MYIEKLQVLRKEKVMRYYIADLHFFHSNINDRLDKRGFANVEEMNEYLVKQWNSKVKPGDEVVIIGDISFGNAEQTNAIVRRLNGTKYLIAYQSRDRSAYACVCANGDYG